MNFLAEGLEEMREAALAKQREMSRTDEERFRDQYRRDVERKEEMLTCLRPAKLGEYGAWLAGYMSLGRVPSMFYDYPEHDIWVATRPLAVHPLHGALSFNGIIIPADVQCDLVEPGHTTLFIDNSTGRYQGKHEYFAWGFHNRMETWISVWSDTRLPS